METKNNRNQYTTLEKQELIEQWKQSGISKLAFTREKKINYFSFCEWARGRKRSYKSKPKNAFLPVEIKGNSSQHFAHLVLKSGAIINLYQPVESSYLVALLKA
jgi:hypothetical protein